MNRVNAKVLSKTQSNRKSANREALEKLKSNRKNQRAAQFLLSRGLEIPIENAIQTRAQRMEEYKQRKLQQKLEAQKKKLPPFRAGIVRHTLDSPYKYFEKREDESVAPVTKKPFKFSLKPKLPAPKITIPYSPKFSRIRGHEVCHEPSTSKNCAIPPTSKARSLSIRPQPSGARQPLTTRPVPRTTRQTTTRNARKDVERRGNERTFSNQTGQSERNRGIGSGETRRESHGTLETKIRSTVAGKQSKGRKISFEENRPSLEEHKRSLERIKSRMNTRQSPAVSAALSENSTPEVFHFASKHTADEQKSCERDKPKKIPENIFTFTKVAFGIQRSGERTNALNENVDIGKLDDKGDEDSNGTLHANHNNAKMSDIEHEDSHGTPHANNNNSKLNSIEHEDSQVDKNGTLGENRSIETESCPMETDLNDSIEIPEHFVKRKSTKDSLRKKVLLTPTKVPELVTLPLSGIEFQRRRLNEERNLLHRTCYLWQDKLASFTNIPADVQDEIDCVLGQTKLLTSDKFEQMSRLIDQFEAQESTGQPAGPRLLENDLDSFWDMMYIQVDLMYTKFDRLKRLEKDDWIDKEEEKKRENAKKPKTKVVAKAAFSGKLGGKSRIADFIRNKRIQAKVDTPVDETKEFNGGFFKVESPVSQKTRSKEPRLSPVVRKSILKNKMSSLNIMAVSPLAKSLTSTVVDFVVTHNTPADQMRSILKKTSSKPKHITPGGKKICFSLSDHSQDEEFFSTPRESPRKQIRKTPHKSHTPDSPGTLNTDAETNQGEVTPNGGPLIAVQLATPQTDKKISKYTPQKENKSPKTPQSAKKDLTLQIENEIILPRKSPRISKAPLRFSFTEFEQKLVLDEKKQLISPKKTRHVTPKRTPRSSSRSSSTKSGRFVLRPSRLAV